MPKLIDYQCVECEKEYKDEFFMDTETPPEELEKKCECGGTLKKGSNLKSNCQVWRWNDHGGL